MEKSSSEVVKTTTLAMQQKVEASKVVNEIKDRAANSEDGPHRIVAEASIGLTAPVAAQMPRPSTLGTR